MDVVMFKDIEPNMVHIVVSMYKKNTVFGTQIAVVFRKKTGQLYCSVVPRLYGDIGEDGYQELLKALQTDKYIYVIRRQPINHLEQYTVLRKCKYLNNILDNYNIF